MNNFEFLKSLSIDELAAWLDKYCNFDHSPWSDWFANKYCANCESIKCKYKDTENVLGFSPYTGEIECAYCELENKCRFFPDLDDTPDNLTTIKMWLKENKE
jgi:hypothetical protein